MATVIAERYRELEEAADRLNRATDHLNEVFGQVDLALKHLGLGLEVWLPVDKTGLQLGYAKLGGRWGLTLRDTTTNQQWLMGDAPRKLQVTIDAAIEDLLKVMAIEADAFTSRIHQSQQSVSATAAELLNAMKKEMPK